MERGCSPASFKEALLSQVRSEQFHVQPLVAGWTPTEQRRWHAFQTDDELAGSAGMWGQVPQQSGANTWF